MTKHKNDGNESANKKGKQKEHIVFFFLCFLDVYIYIYMYIYIYLNDLFLLLFIFMICYMCFDIYDKYKYKKNKLYNG